MENIDRQKQKKRNPLGDARAKFWSISHKLIYKPSDRLANQLARNSSKLWLVIKTKIEIVSEFNFGLLYYSFWMVDFGQIGELDEIGQSGFIALDGARLDYIKSRLVFELVWTSLNKFIFIFLHFFHLNQKNLEWWSWWSVDFNIGIDFMNK